MIEEGSWHLLVAGLCGEEGQLTNEYLCWLNEGLEKGVPTCVFAACPITFALVVRLLLGLW